MNASQESSQSWDTMLNDLNNASRTLQGQVGVDTAMNVLVESAPKFKQMATILEQAEEYGQELFGSNWALNLLVEKINSLLKDEKFVSETDPSLIEMFHKVVTRNNELNMASQQT